MTITERLSATETQEPTPFYGGFPAKTLAKVSNLTTRLRLPAGTELAQQDAWGKELVIVVDGSVDVIVDGAIVASRGAGHLAGGLALLHDRPEAASVVAGTEVTVDVIGRREFATMVRIAPRLVARLQHATVA